MLRAGGPGEGDADPITRNRAISQAYAEFYQRNPKLEWAGIASIVSSNAGCAMRAADVVKADAEREADGLIQARREMPVVPTDGGDGAEFVEPAARGWAAGVARAALAKGNKEIFRDVYPVLRMHERYGNDGINTCGNRPGHAPVDPGVATALSRAYSPDPVARNSAGDLFARHEQTQVLENSVFNPKTAEGVENRVVLGLSQQLAKTEFGRGLGAQAPEVRLTSGCADGTPAVPFPGNFLDKEKRVSYYLNDLVKGFRALDPNRRASVIERLARGGAGSRP